MAALVGDFGMERASAHYHGIISTTSSPYSQQSSETRHYRSSSRSNDGTSRKSSHAPSPTTRQQPSRGGSHGHSESSPATDKTRSIPRDRASHIPSPPSTASTSGSLENVRHDTPRRCDNATMPPQEAQQHSPHTTFMSDSATRPSSHSRPTLTPPSTNTHTAGSTPSSDGHVNTYSSTSHSSNTRPQRVTRVRDLNHIQSLARADLSGTGRGSSGGGILDERPLHAMKYEISDMPIGDIIEMVAALLTKITTTNDQQHDRANRTALDRNANHIKQAQAQNDGSASEMSPTSSSVLAFHGKNVPAITILSYLSRIHKYCPTTYEVFLSLLVYFDRMTERVNDMVVKAEEVKAERRQSLVANEQKMEVDSTPSKEHSDESDEDLADDDSDDGKHDAPRIAGKSSPKGSSSASSASSIDDVPATSQPTYFVVDNFNIHRLIIAGVTCSSKFFSDVFYTNSRYAKVGGLPLPELNHLELQFLLLNDFRLAVAVEDLEAYATMLVEFYAREVVAQRIQSS